MVVFTCNHCGDSLQKPKVEKHYNFTCRTTKSLTCIDCLKDFRGEEYANHTKCLTEEERYAAKGAFANGIVKKGEVKQESWIEMIKSIIEKETNLKPPIRNLLNTISNNNNVPRKKIKFINFIKSSSGGRANMKDVEEVWDIIEKYKASQLNKNKSQENGINKANKMDNAANGLKESTINNNISEPNESSENGITKKKKKSKIEKSLENDNAENLKTENNDSTIHQEKKSKKKKQSPENVTTIQKMDVGLVEENADIKDKKNKKSKKKKIDNSEEAESNGIFENGDSNNIDLSNSTQETDTKKKTKKKKLQEVETEDVNNAKKLKLDIPNEENSAETPNSVEENFDFRQKILEILTSKGTISTKKLEKKVVNAYLKHFGLSDSSPKILKKFNKKLKKLDNIEIVDNNVILKQHDNK